MTPNLVAVGLAAALGCSAASVLAGDVAKREAQQVIDLSDGSTLYVFRDGKMAKEDKLGRAVNLRSGEVLEARDGRKVTAVGNEVAYLHMLLISGHRD